MGGKRRNVCVSLEDLNVRGGVLGDEGTRTTKLRIVPSVESGQVAAAPPMAVMDSRRFTASASRASDRKNSTPREAEEDWGKERW